MTESPPLSSWRPQVTSIRAARWQMSVVEDHWEYALGAVQRIPGLVIAVSDADGNVGYGYSTAYAFDGETLDSLIGTVSLIASAAAWRELTLPEARTRWDRMIYGNQRAKAGLELALLDLIGRRDGLPVHELLGFGAGLMSSGYTRILAVDTAERMQARARELVGQGAAGIKIKVDGDFDIDARRVRAVREALDGDARLVVDANGSYTVAGAIRLGRVLDECGVAVFEQPVSRSDLAGLGEVRRATDCLVEADESAATVADVLQLAAHRSVDAISIKIPKMGGLLPALRIAQLCADLGLQYRLGAHFASRLYESACAHLLACAPSGQPHESAEPEHLGPDPFDRSFVRDGALILSPEPGLGVPEPAVPAGDWEFEW